MVCSSRDTKEMAGGDFVKTHPRALHRKHSERKTASASSPGYIQCERSLAATWAFRRVNLSVLGAGGDTPQCCVQEGHGGVREGKGAGEGPGEQIW